MKSNLPPGVSNYDIERAAGAFENEIETVNIALTLPFARVMIDCLGSSIQLLEALGKGHLSSHTAGLAALRDTINNQMPQGRRAQLAALKTRSEK